MFVCFFMTGGDDVNLLMAMAGWMGRNGDGNWSG